MSGADMEAHPAPVRVLVACVGNIFFGDDGFGVEVARKLAASALPEGVRVVDFGIRGVDLAYSLLDGCETLVLVDAVPRGGTPGTLYLIEPPNSPAGEAATAESGPGMVDAHSMDPMKVLAFARRLGARPGRALIVGCEPATPTTPEAYDEILMGLSEPVQAAVDEAVIMVQRVIEAALVRSAPATA